MRIAIQAVISDVEGQEPCTEDIGVLEHNAEAAANSGLCFSLEPPMASNERVADALGAANTLITGGIEAPFSGIMSGPTV
jgi:hypothetical protein